MDERQRGKVEQIIAFELDLALRALPDARERVFADHSMKGIIRSGATIKRTVAAFAEIGAKLIADLATKCAAISREPAVHGLMQSGFAEFLNGIDEAMTRVIYVAGGGKSESITKAANDLVAKAKADLVSRLQITGFEFEGELPEVEGGPPPPKAAATVTPVNVGGRPLAAHWDKMWASIAQQLYAGDLAPKTQANIERAMTAWLVDHGHNASENTIRGRARTLWQEIQSKG